MSRTCPGTREQISNCTYRQFTTGFFYGKPDETAQIYDSNTYVKEYTYLGIVGEANEKGLYRIEQRNKFSVGETIEVMKPDGRNLSVTVKRIVNEEGEEQKKRSPSQAGCCILDLGDGSGSVRHSETERVASKDKKVEKQRKVLTAHKLY